MNDSQFLDGILAHPYLTIITVSVVQGRIPAFIAGMFAAAGLLNPVIAYAIFCIMDILGDTLWYLISRFVHHLIHCFGHRFGKYIIKKIGWQEKVNEISSDLIKYLPRALFIGKITFAGKPMIITAGIAKMPFLKFYGVVVPCTLIQFLLFIGLGYLFYDFVS